MSSPSDFLTSYRAQFPDDPRTDAELAGIFGIDPTPRPTNPEAAVAATAPKGGFGTSLRAGIESGTYGLGETLSNAAALAADWVPGTFADPVRDSMLRSGREYSEAASAASAKAPVRELEQIEGAGDFVNWAAYGLGSLAPTMAETVAVAGISGLAGGAATSETGPGAVVGAAGGAAAGFVARKAAKKIIAKLARAGVKETLEGVLEKGAKYGLQQEMKNVAGSLAASAAGGINSWALSSGEIYGNLLQNANISPEDARNYATGMGAVAALPDTILPGYLWGRFFDKPIKEVSKKEAASAGKFLLQYMLNTGEEAAKVGALEGSTEAFQEWVNVAAEHWADPESAAGGFDISPEEWSRIKNAGAVGALAGVVGAPAVGYGATRQEFAPTVVEAPQAAPDTPSFVPASAPAVPVAAPVSAPVAPPLVVPQPIEQVSVAPVPPAIPVVEAPVVPAAPVVSAPVEATPVAPVVEAPPTNIPVAAEAPPPAKIAGLDEWHPLDTQPSVGQLKAYGTEVGVSQNEKAGKPALSRMSVVTQNPDGSINVNGVYSIPNSKEGVRVHEGGTTGRAVTNRDIAEALGLSVSTVTSANKASSTVSQATRDLVKETRLKLMETRAQNRGIEQFVAGKQVLGFLKTTEASEDFRRTFANKAEFDSALSGLQESQIKKQEAKKAVVERKQLGLLANDIVGTLEKSGPEGATAAAVLNAAADEIAGRTMVSKREALHSLISRDAWKNPGEIVHPVQVFFVPEKSIKALSLFNPKELVEVLALSPEDAVLRLRATLLSKRIEIPVAEAEAFLGGTLTEPGEAAKIETLIREEASKTDEGDGKPRRSYDQRWAEAYAKRGETRVGNKGTIQYDEAKKTQTKVDDYDGTSKTVESPEVSFVAPTIPDELDGAPVGSPAAVRTTPNELLVAKGIYARLDGKTINQKNDVAVVEFLAKFQKALVAVAARKESVQLGIFNDGRLNDMEYVASLAKEAALSERYTGQLPSIHRVSDAFIRKAFNRVAQYAGNMGMDIRLVQGVVDSASELIANEQAKIVTDTNTGRTIITVALNDIASPTRDNLKGLMHEVAHAVVRTLPGWQQRATHDAIWSAFEKGELRRASNDPRLHNWETAERAGLSKSEFLEELLVEHITALGMERVKSKTIVQEIIQMIRRALAIAGKTLAAAKGYVFGNDATIIEFAENEFASVIDKALAPRMNLLEWVGLARRSPSEKAVYFGMSAEGMFAQSYNPVTGELGIQNMILDSAAAVTANVEQIMDQLFYRSNAEVLTLEADSLKYELGLMEKPPGQADIPDTYLVTVFNYGEGIPVAVQMDVVENGENTWSGSMEAVRELGYFVPDFSSLPTGQYTAKEAVAKVRGLTESNTRQLKSKLQQPFRVTVTRDNGVEEFVSEHETLAEARTAAAKIPNAHAELDAYITQGSDPSPALLTQLNVVAQGVADIVDRLTNGQARLNFIKDADLPTDYAKDGHRIINGFSVNDLIAINTTAMAIHSANGDIFRSLSTAAHESWHFLQDQGFVSKEEMVLLRKSLPQLREFLSKTYGDVIDWNTLREDEVFAFSFGEYAKLVMTGHPGDFPNITAVSVMEKVYQFFKRVATLLKSLGYSDVQDFTVKNIFYKAWSGEIGTRIPTRSREVLYTKQDELRTDQKPVFDAKIKFGMETTSATLNSLESRLNEIFVPLLKGASLESYLDKVLKVGTGAVPISKMRERLAADAKLHGADGKFNGDLSLDGKGANEITNPVLLDQVQRETYRNMEKLGEKVRKTHNSEVRNIEKDLRTNSRKKEKWLSALGNFNNAEVLRAPIVTDIKRLVKNLNTDLVSGVARKPVTEALRELLGYDITDRQVTAEFIPALKSADEWISTGTHLLDAVTEISKLGLDYEDSPSTNRDKIKASGIPMLQDLTDGTPIATAKLTLLLTAAKNEPGMFGLARLRVEKDSKIKFELGKLLSDALAGDNARWTVLLNSARASIGEAKYSKEMLKAINLDRRRLISEYESLVKRKADLPQYEIAEKAIAEGLSKLQSEAGYFLADTPLIDGSEVFHIKNPGADREEVLSESSKTKISLIGDEAAVLVTKIWMDNGLWLKTYTGPKDAVYHRVREQTDKLGMMMTRRQQTEGKKWWGTQFIQSISDRLIDTGSPLAKDAARMLTRYADRRWSNVDRVRVLGDNVLRKYGEVAKLFKLAGNAAEVHSLFFDPSYAFIEAHPEITDKNQMYAELKAHLMNGSKVAEKLLRENPTGFQKVTELLEANAEAFTALRNLADSWGVLVEDSGMKIYNPLTGESEPVMRHGRAVSMLMAPRTTRKVGQLYEKMGAIWAGENTFGLRYIADRYLGNDVMKNKSFQSTLDKQNVEAKKKTIQSLQLFMSERPAGREGVVSGLKDYFDQAVIADFVLPLVRKGEVFSGVNKGYAKDSNVLAAWNNSGNEVVAFAENLFDLEYVKKDGVSESDVLTAKAKFVAETIGTFVKYFHEIRDMSRASSKEKAFLGQESIRHSLMDARRASVLPYEWTEYALGTPEMLHVVLDNIAIHSTMGRDMQDFKSSLDTVNKQVGAAVDSLTKRRLAIRRTAELSGEILSAKQVEKRLQMSFTDQSEYRTLMALAKNKNNIEKIDGEVDAWQHTQTNPDTDLKVPLGITRSIAGLMVNNWRTFLYNANALFSPFMRYKLSRAAVSQFLNTLRYTKDEVVGTLLSAFGKQLSETAAEKQAREELGMFIDPEVYTDMYGRWANPGAGGNYEADSTGRTVARMRKTVDTITNFGWGGNARYAKLRPFGALNMGSIMFKRALMRGQLRTVSNLIGNAVKYFEQHPEAAGDPSFRFSADILGYKDRMGMDERGAYEGLTDSLSKSGYPLELVAREAYAKKRQKGYNGSLLTVEQSQAIMARALDELSLEASVSNVPIWTQTNSFARAAMPLLTWPMIQTNTVLKSFLNEDGQASLRAARYGIKAMLLAIVPMSLAYTLLMDEWDEEVLGRKGNLAPLSLDQGFSAFAGASIERLARMGTFGLGGDLVNGYRVYGTDGDLRGLSFDQRVLFMNSFLTMNRTISTLVQQGPSNLTYETFYRTLASSLGAGQAIQYMQLLNNYGDDLVGVKPFTAEAEALKRLNVRYFLSAGGRLTGLEVRGRTSGGTTNSVRPWITRMGVAAMSDDAQEFQEAYRNAVREARELGEDDPEEYVKRSFGSGHPLRSTFKTPPTEAEIARLVGTLNEYGQDTVRSAIRAYDRYGESLGIKPYSGRQVKTEKSVKTTVNPLDVKRRAKQALFQ